MRVPTLVDRQLEAFTEYGVGAMNDHAVGEHVLADFHGVAPTLLQDSDLLMALLDRCLKRSSFRVLARRCHKFRTGGEGVTGFFLLSESHAAFHSYPERRYIAVDVFSCGSGSAREVICDFGRSLDASEKCLTSVVRPGERVISLCG